MDRNINPVVAGVVIAISSALIFGTRYYQSQASIREMQQEQARIYANEAHFPANGVLLHSGRVFDPNYSLHHPYHFQRVTAGVPAAKTTQPPVAVALAEK